MKGQSSAQQGVGSDDKNLPPFGKWCQIPQVEVSDSFQVSGVAVGMAAKE